MDIVLVIPEDSIILDLGTGHGLVLIKFASKISSEGHVTGIGSVAKFKNEKQ